MGATCPQCRHELPGGTNRCGYCGATTDASKPAVDPVALGIDVRARIFWGDEPAKVRAEFLKTGAAPRDLDPLIQKAVQERRAHFKQKGRLDLLKGAGFGVMLILALITWHFVTHGGPGGGPATGGNPGMVFIGLMSFPVASVFFVYRGLRRIRTGGIGERDVSELEEDGE